MYICTSQHQQNDSNTVKRVSSHADSFRRTFVVPFLLFLTIMLAGCQAELYRGLTEYQANEMLSALLRRNIPAQKIDNAKNGFAISVDEENLVQALEILKENSLPGEKYQSLGSVFAGQGMIASPTEEQARLGFAISQELANTFSRIDGVLTARVHVVLAETDQNTQSKTAPSAAVFLRHAPESPVVNLITKIRETTAKAVPGLAFDQVSVMLVPVRESVSVPYKPTQSVRQTLLHALQNPDGAYNLPALVTFVFVILCFVLAVIAGIYRVLHKGLQARAAAKSAGNE